MSDLPPMEESSAPSIITQPHSRESEEAVLGAVLINPEVYFDIAQILQPDDFYIVRNRWVWEAFTRLHDRRIPIDYITVTQELEQSNQLIELGGPAYITALASQTPSSIARGGLCPHRGTGSHPPPDAGFRQPDGSTGYRPRTQRR